MTGLPNPSRETRFLGTNAGREMLIFSVQPTTCRIGNLTRLIHTLVVCVTIHTYRSDGVHTVSIRALRLG